MTRRFWRRDVLRNMPRAGSRPCAALARRAQAAEGVSVARQRPRARECGRARRGAGIERRDRARGLPETLLECLEPPEEDAGYHASVSKHKRTVIEEALTSAGGNVAQAARTLGLQPTYYTVDSNLGVKERPQE